MCFFISWGAHDDVRELGQLGMHSCEACKQDSDFTAVVTYRVRHVYWLFRWVTNRRRAMACNNCGALYPADPETFDTASESAAIPFMDRRGWTLGAGALASLVGVGVAASAADDSSDAEYLAHPQVGDIYEVDMAQLMDEPEARVMYSAMRVVSVEGSTVEVQLANGYYDRRRGVTDDIRDGATSAASYYMDETGFLEVSELQQMYAEGALYEVDR